MMGCTYSLVADPLFVALNEKLNAVEADLRAARTELATSRTDLAASIERVRTAEADAISSVKAEQTGMVERMQESLRESVDQTAKQVAELGRVFADEASVDEGDSLRASQICAKLTSLPGPSHAHWRLRADTELRLRAAAAANTRAERSDVLQGAVAALIDYAVVVVEHPTVAWHPNGQWRESSTAPFCCARDAEPLPGELFCLHEGAVAEPHW